MPDWEVSRHPSWDRMYILGMTVREIADYTGHPRSTVHRHLRMRERIDGTLRPVHEIRNRARGPGWPATYWRNRYAELQHFIKHHGRLPHHSGDKAEMALSHWLGEQRREHARGSLSDVKTATLSTIKDWDTTPSKRSFEERWQQRLTQLVAFMDQHDHWPRWKRHTSEHERVLGVWLHTQHQARADGTLLPWRLEVLNTALPGWHSTM